MDRLAVQRPGARGRGRPGVPAGRVRRRGVALRLHDLMPEATYEITSLEQPGTARATGRELMTEGLRVVLREKPSAAVVLYRRAK